MLALLNELTPESEPMTPRTLALTDTLHDYLRQVGFREPELLQKLREETLRLPRASMLLAPEQGQFMALVARLMGVERYLEVGTFTGYSALAIALALGPNGTIITCDIDPNTTRIAQRYWRQARVANRIELRLGPALSTIEGILAQGKGGAFDMAFIDADKENLLAYYERCIKLVRPGGLILVDNTLWEGSVADSSDHDRATEAIRAFNVAVHADPRVDMVLLPIGDGLTLARPRS
jgi:predicted O-methyltransferase YrrM